jgi:hypothetical protein
MAHLIGVLKHENDIIFIAWPNIARREAMIHMDRNVWPDIKALLDRSPICAANFEMETVW